MVWKFIRKYVNYAERKFKFIKRELEEADCTFLSGIRGKTF